MNEELLKAVARCAPEWMEAEYKADKPCVTLHSEGVCWLDLQSDQHNAEAIIAMLDAMEREGVETRLTTLGNTYMVRVHRPTYRKYDFAGKTRAEAVAKAFVEVFKK